MVLCFHYKLLFSLAMNRKHRPSPSFSSSLLDEIYRSIDGEKKHEEKHENGHKTREKVAIKKNYWSSTSSDSSSGGGFSSSETESRASNFKDYRLRPVRTVGLPVQNRCFEPLREQIKVKSNENGFGKTKAKAMKIYGDLKKVKQPISPGGRLATFLNSLFTSSTPKKAKTSSSRRSSFDEKISHNIPKLKRASFDETISQNNPKSKPSYTSTCSSASSFSRSCLSNSSSRDKTSNETKRSVRFYPVSVVLGEDSCPKYKNEARNMVNNEVKIHIMEKNRRVEEAARDLLKKYQQVEYEYLNVRDSRKKEDKKFNYIDDEDEDDDAASYASSDLFELDHLSAIEELPVYETTHLRTNLAIANGLIS